jgi:hypothetical protein
MPFEQTIPRPFNLNSVQVYAPNSAGLYGISNSREWIYIGEAENIRAALMAHLEDASAPLMKRQPTGFVFEATNGPGRAIRQDRLILEYEPFCNRHSSRHA